MRAISVVGSSAPRSRSPATFAPVLPRLLGSDPPGSPNRWPTFFITLLAAGMPRDQLGLGPGRLGVRVIGAAALTVVLLLPAAVRWTGQEPLTGWFAVAAVVISAGEELAFRGALFAALEQAFGPWVAV